MDFLWFWVSAAVLVEVTRRSVSSCYPKTLNKANSDLKSLKDPLLEPVERKDCPYSCCFTDIHTCETDTEESSITTESIDEFLSSEENEEYEESLADSRRTGKHLVKNDDGVQDIVGRLYPSVPGRPKLVHFKVSDNYFTVSDTVGARLAKEGSAKIHPHPNGLADQVNSSMLHSSSSQFNKDKQGIRSEEIADQYGTLPPMQEVMSSH